MHKDKKTYGGMFTRGDLYEEEPVDENQVRLQQLRLKADKFGLDLNDPKVVATLKHMEDTWQSRQHQVREIVWWKRWLLVLFDRSRRVNVVSVGYCLIAVLTISNIYRMLSMPLKEHDTSSYE